MKRRLLRIYLNDHRAGAIGLLALAERCWSANRGTPLGDDLEVLIDEERRDRVALETLMSRLRLPLDRLKPLAASLAERIGRLKLNGQLRGYSDLSRLYEVEALCLGAEAKLGRWRALREAASGDHRIDLDELDRLIDRAVDQRRMLERHRLEAARRALG